MIIDSLTLHNFMSYAEANLDLSSVEVACLTGSNGAGKSALLDAISWALWETARAPSDELIRIGQQEMWVDLRFSLEGQSYRVRRSRQRSFSRDGKQIGSRGNLELQISEEVQQIDFAAAGSAIADARERGESGNDRQGSYGHAQSSQAGTERTTRWRSLSAAGTRETQKRLRELLRMDYETFITSVYLRQGRADEFAVRSANERKQVLSDILGLDYFDRLQELCREESRECKGRIQVMEANLNERAHFEQGFELSASKMQSVRAELSEVLDHMRKDSEMQAALESELSELSHIKIRRNAGKERCTELQADLQSLQRRSRELAERTRHLESIISQSEFIITSFREFEECKQLSESLDRKSNEHSELVSRRLNLRSGIALGRGRIEVELEHSKRSLESLQKRKQSLETKCKDEQKIETAFQHYRNLLEAELEMSRKRETHFDLSKRADELQSLIAEERVRIEAQIQQKEGLLVQLDEIISGADQMEIEERSLKNDLEQIEKVEADFELVEERGLKVKTEIDSLQQQQKQLKNHLRNNHEKMQELSSTPDLSSCPLCRSSIVDAAAVLEKYRADNNDVESEMIALDARISDLSRERDSLRKRYLELRARLEERKNLDMKIGEFNARHLALERAASSKEELMEEIRRSKMILDRNLFAPVEKESLIRVKAELSKLDFDPIVFASFQSQMRSQRHVELRYQQFKRDRQELEELDRQIPDLDAQIKKMECDLKEERFALSEKAETEEIERMIAELSYDKVSHQEIKGKLLQLLPCAEKARELEKARDELPALKDSLSETENMLESRKSELQRLHEELGEWSSRLDEEPDKSEELNKLKRKRLEDELRKETLQKELILLETRLQQLQADKSDLASKRNRLEASIKELNEYQLLAEAFGKKGLQAVIIENVIPEIEAEANRLLAKLSDNRMHLSLITQQRNKQGVCTETLDIVIADEIGSRSYELYSGGEAFKINFALRVAISRLLSRRAGARLETLIIDEGFGSQDDRSREKVVQAISSIRSDFSRIIIVTHVAEIKEMFPAQINISKESGISEINLSG